MNCEHSVGGAVLPDELKPRSYLPQNYRRCGFRFADDNDQHDIICVLQSTDLTQSFFVGTRCLIVEENVIL